MDIHWILTINSGLIIQWATLDISIGTGGNPWVLPSSFTTNNYSVHMSTTHYSNPDVFYGAFKDTITQAALLFCRPYCDGVVIPCHTLAIGY